MSKHGRILVAMSGGIDSTVTAIMLHDEGYEVVGITMKTWDYSFSGGNKKETGCCSLDSINDARIVAVQRGFHHIILDLRAEFGNFIIDNFKDEYMAGRTPNPCVLCNTHIKWEALLKRANQLGCEHIATGHYARVRKENGRFIISRGLDENKDQSYVLWGLSQENLARTKFPLGKFRKSEIREMAVKNGFSSLARKRESFEICFVPDNDYRGFLKRKVPGLAEKVAGGNFVDTQGKILGKHTGYPFYTIGQRKGLGIALGDPLFVVEIIPETNTIVLGSKKDLQKDGLTVINPNLVKLEKIPPGLEVITRIRYKDSGTLSQLTPAEGKIKVAFFSKVTGVAPGQSAVFYEGDDVVGGGFIEKPHA